MKSIFLWITLVVCVAGASGATPPLSTAESMANAVMADTSMVYGIGQGMTHAEADREALSNLMSKITVNVSASFEMNEQESAEADGEHRAAFDVQHMVRTYSQGTLHNTRSLMLSHEPDCRVMRYIKRSEIDKVFDGRRDKVADMVRTAQRARERRKIDDALRNYYWALTLLRSLPQPESMIYEDRVLLHWIPEQINELLDALKVSVARVDSTDVDVMVTFEGEPVETVEYSYFDGRQWSARFCARDGMGTLTLLPDTPVDNIQLKFEYEYADQSGIDRELDEVSRLLKGVPFGKAYKNLPARKGKLAASREGRKRFDRAVADAGKTKSIAPVGRSREQACDEVLQRVTAAISSGKYGGIDECFTPGGRKMFDGLVKYGKARVLGKTDVTYYPMGERVVARSVPMSFTFPGNNRVFVEDVTFTFDADNRIESLAMGLGSEADRTVFDRGGDSWSQYAKMILVTFIENYKTAFALKRYDYIESIFDENASIIVGHVMKRPGSKGPDGAMTLPGEMVSYTHMTKDRYLRHLERVFATQPYINIRFTDAEVVKMGVGGESYGIQLKQDYYSTGYADTGYLFLLVDFNNPEEPSIKVRAWQPERNPDINSHLPSNHPDYGLIGPGNF